MFSKNIDQRLRNLSLYRLSIWKRMRIQRGSGQKVGHFLSSDFSIESTVARPQIHPVKFQSGTGIFSSNHLSAVVLELITIFLLLLLGFFSEAAIFQIPAGASIFLFFGFILMIIGAISFWLRGWSMTVFLGITILINIFCKINPHINTSS